MNGKFTHVRTHTIPKISVERNWRDPAMDTLPLRNGLVVTMIGHVSGLVPHLYEFSIKGIHEEDVIVVDRDPLVIAELQTEVRRLGLLCHVVLGDYYDILSILLHDGNVIKFADFDGTSNISKYHYNLVQLYQLFPNQIECMSICAATRSPTGRTGVEELVQFIRQDVGLSCIARSYHNQGPMVSILLSPYQIYYKLPDNQLAASIHQLMLDGKTQRLIACELGIDRNIVHGLPKKHPIVFSHPS